MPAFRYNGRTARGEAVAGSVESDSPEALATHLFARGITPIDIKPVAKTHNVLGELWQRLGGPLPQPASRTTSSTANTFLPSPPYSGARGRG